MRIVAAPEDLGPTGYIDDAVYLRWVQAVVIRHWERFASDDARSSTLWIAIRHRLAFRSPATAKERLVARTRISRAKGVRAEFRTVFCRGSEILAEVESTWVSLDAGTGKPKALEARVLDAFRLT